MPYARIGFFGLIARKPGIIQMFHVSSLRHAPMTTGQCIELEKSQQRNPHASNNEFRDMLRSMICRSDGGRVRAVSPPMLLVAIVVSLTFARAVRGAPTDITRTFMGDPGSLWLSLDDLDFQGDRRWALRLGADYAKNPLVLGGAGTSESVRVEQI